MADTQDGASEAGRLLAQQRWGSQVVSRAVQVVLDRRDQLDEAQLAELRQVTSRQGADGDG